MVKNLAFIGMGIMGRPMALNLLKAGFALTVHSRTKSKAQDVLEAGALWAESPALAAKDKDIVITCVTDTPDVKNVLLGKEGVIESAHPGMICVDMSTISPFETQEMAKVLAAKKVALIDAPISGGQIGAIEAKLSIMAGGDKAAFEKVRPVFEAMGRTITYCGPSGFGQITKLTNQIMVVHTVMSMAEGLAFAKQAGLNLQTTLDATVAGAAGSHSLKVLGAKVVAGDFKPAFMIDLQVKDLRLVLEYADKIGQPLPGVALIKELFSVLQAQGRGRDGTQSLYDVIRQMAAQK
ncbi:MAG: 2-hydroxy-3-oxopropionate reductase [Planctomycetes bacterium ADurb.Bin401]|nr:MAG: 2-hydroxy-3-oxopropionate reductase [Planctomycetes bacterium ADurb.Bin401]